MQISNEVLFRNLSGHTGIYVNYFFPYDLRDGHRFQAKTIEEKVE
jgi:hypothetical protein